MTVEALAVVEALLSASVAWRSPAHLAAGSGLPLPAVFCALADLEADEWICHWETEDELTVTLTPIGAARLGVRLIEVGHNEHPRWTNIESPDPPLPKAKGIFRDYQALALIPDPRSEVSLDEEAELVPVADPAGCPGLGSPGAPDAQPHRHLEHGDPGHLRAPGEPCPACGSALSKRAGCPYCSAPETVAAPRSNRNRARSARRSANARVARKARRKARSST